MKIDASNINLSSKRVYFQKDEVLIEKQVVFTNLFAQKIKGRGNDVFREPPDIGGNGGSPAVTFAVSSRGILLQTQFLEELEKLRQILYEILKNVNSGGMSHGRLMFGGFDRVTFNLFSQNPATLFKCEYLEKQTYTHYETENTDFSANGKVITKDGRTLDFSFNMGLDREFFREDQFIHQEQGYVLKDPLVIHLDTAAPRLSEARISLDLDLDGETENISVPGQGSGFLALDSNQDGRINDGSELFGPSTGDGFMELSRYDLDQNLWIDENDEIFNDLSFWGTDEKGEMHLKKISDAGMGAIYLASIETPFDFRGKDNQLEARAKKSGIALNEDGSVSAVQQMDWTVSNKAG